MGEHVTPEQPDNVADVAVATVQALMGFIEPWSDGELMRDIAPRLSCLELDALTGLFTACGFHLAAEHWTAEHAKTDDIGDKHTLNALPIYDS